MECIYKAAPGLSALNQRRGDDPRMTRAVAARLANPEVSLHRALLMGGFKFSKNIMHDTISAPFTYRKSSVKNNMKNREGGIYDCDNILLSQRKKQLRKRLHLIVVYNKNKKDRTTERKEGFHCSTYCNIRKENSAAAVHHAATGAMLGMNTAVKMVSATEHTSSKNASNHSTHHAVLQDAINELQVLKEIESSLNQEIHTFTSSCSSSVIQNTTTLQDCFKPVRDDNSINVHPTILEDQPSIPLVYQKDAMNTAIHPPLPSLNLNKRSQPDLFWPTHLRIPRGDPLSLLYHPQHPHSANPFRGMTMGNYLAATSYYHNSRRMRRYEYITLLNEMKKKKKKHQLYRDALMLAGPHDDFRNNKILGKSIDEK